MGRTKIGDDSGGLEAAWMSKTLHSVCTYLENCSSGDRFLRSFCTCLPNYSGYSSFPNTSSLPSCPTEVEGKGPSEN